MNVNATLIVQALNFCLAYLMFRFIVLKPAYRAIQEEDQHKEALQDLVSTDEQLLQDKKQIRLDQWVSCKSYCKKYIPPMIDEVALFRGIAPKTTVTPPSKKALDTMKDNITKTIVSLVGVRNDRA